MEEEEEEATTLLHNKFDEILTLFDHCWFHHLILFSRPTPTPPPPPPPPRPALPEPQTQPPLRSPLKSPHRRTRSNESAPTFPRFSLEVPRLQTIPSGKEALYPIETSQPHLSDVDTVKRMTNRLNRRSVSELELEELRGLMDLGFNFSDTEVETDPKIADIVPGLRKRSCEVEVVRRPYLSEAWRVRDGKERRKMLRGLDWSVLANGDERDVKEQLRRWAHVVASTVR